MKEQFCSFFISVNEAFKGNKGGWSDIPMLACNHNLLSRTGH